MTSNIPGSLSLALDEELGGQLAQSYLLQWHSKELLWIEYIELVWARNIHEGIKKEFLAVLDLSYSELKTLPQWACSSLEVSFIWNVVVSYAEEKVRLPKAICIVGFTCVHSTFLKTKERYGKIFTNTNLFQKALIPEMSDGSLHLPLLLPFQVH